jgi:hypothetical protein
MSPKRGLPNSLQRGVKGIKRLSLENLLPLVNRELRQLAHLYMRWERPGHTLQTTALVNKAYLRRMRRYIGLEISNPACWLR